MRCTADETKNASQMTTFASLPPNRSISSMSHFAFTKHAIKRQQRVSSFGPVHQHYRTPPPSHTHVHSPRPAHHTASERAAPHWNQRAAAAGAAASFWRYLSTRLVKRASSGRSPPRPAFAAFRSCRDGFFFCCFCRCCRQDGPSGSVTGGLGWYTTQTGDTTVTALSATPAYVYTRKPRWPVLRTRPVIVVLSHAHLSYYLY